MAWDGGGFDRYRKKTKVNDGRNRWEKAQRMAIQTEQVDRRSEIGPRKMYKGITTREERKQWKLSKEKCPDNQ